MNRATALALLALALAAVAAAPAKAGTISLTGAELNADPAATFPGTRSRTVNGPSLDIGTASGSNEVLITYSIAPAGALGAGSPSTPINITVNLTRLTTDHDIWYGLWDGTRFIFVTSWDGNRSFGSAGDSSDGLTFGGGGAGTVTGYASEVPVGSSFNIGVEFDLGAAGPSYQAVFPDGTLGPLVNGGPFDRTAAISLLVGMGSPTEQTRINSVTIDSPLIPEPIPEPSTLSLCGLGVLGVAAGVARRRRRQS